MSVRPGSKFQAYFYRPFRLMLRAPSLWNLLRLPVRASDVSDWRGDEHVCWNSPFLRSGYRRGQCDSDLYPLLQRATLNDGTATAKLIAFEHAHPVPPLAPSGRCVVPSNSSIGQTTTPGRLKKTELGQEVQCDPFAAQSGSNTHQTPHRPYYDPAALWPTRLQPFRAAPPQWAFSAWGAPVGTRGHTVRRKSTSAPWRRRPRDRRERSTLVGHTYQYGLEGWRVPLE